MPPVIKLEDQNELVETKKFKLAKFPFEFFNPPQSRVFEIYDKDANVVIAANTSAGKTVMAEMIAAHTLNKKKGKVLYLAPLKALAKEKIDDWTNSDHHFNNYKLAIVTGDYQLTVGRKKELEEADIILMTTEMLSSRCRNYNSEKNEFLKNISVVICDEVHLLTVPGRGDHLEVGLMKFCQLNSNARLVFLSATMPNVLEIAEWASYVLNNKETYLIKSDYRPVPLCIHYERYYDVKRYEANEQSKVETAVGIVEKYPDDKFLIFAHTKRTGELMRAALVRAGFPCEFHYSDLEKDKRHELENRFRKDKEFKILIATSGLAWGINSPSRRVIVVGLHRGLSEVENYDITQMIGRCGRIGWDIAGDCYILIPETQKDFYINKLKKPTKIDSKLLEHVGNHYKCLAFHLVSEIHHRNIKTREDVHKWYEKSLAYHQAKGLLESIVDSTLTLLINMGAIKEEDGEYKATAVGIISSMFYYSPFDVSDLKKNFDKLFSWNGHDNDLILSMALGDIDTIRMGICSKVEKDEMSAYSVKTSTLQKIFDKMFADTSIKGGFCYYSLLHGKTPPVLAGQVRNLQFDFPRMLAVLQALDSMACKWGKKDWFNELQMRIQYGVKSELIPLCKIADIGKVRAEKLFLHGFKNANDVAKDPDKVQRVLNMKKASIDKICQNAKILSLIS
jgi:replicative superfamily II helicase